MSTLHLSPDAPVLLQVAATAALVLHIGGGTAGIASGAVAMVARKGGRLHRISGVVFFVSMLVMTVVAGIVAPMMPTARWTNTTAAIFTFYLVITSWVTVRRRPDQVGVFEVAALMLAVGLALEGLALVWIDIRDPAAQGFESVYVFCAVAALAAGCDLVVILKGGVRGPARVARHLWRMSLAMVIATASLFVGQQQVLPEPVRGTLLVAIPPLSALAAMIYWLVRIRWPRNPRRRTATA